ncbi:hypothetical protein DNU06_08315 [Putridiphycobacter roseus]|uniref:Lipoprotein n=1 Tax=Putridiphycobacter roseus TaxID=2219161 RepID=A0A2W1NRI0_9FLAO|nr:hypothetical protein [Putridiphycobacter roseus]PZE17268.1 hypothetical protein DNU06_08315 [Putridiphycobacter roseus]
MKKSGLFSLLLVVIIAFTACKKKEEEEEVIEEPISNVGSKLTELPDGDQTFKGNLSNGEKLSDLSWAWNSSMACFVEPGKSWFEGNHVFYQIDIPKQTTIDIFLNATNSSDDIAIYAYSKGAGDKTIPPNISSCVSCEAAPSNSYAITGEKHLYLNATTNPYSIIIGVAGATGLTSGEYTISIDVES